MFLPVQRLPIVLCAAIASATVGVASAQQPARLLDSSALHSQYQNFLRRAPVGDEAARTARWSDFARLASAVVGQSMDDLRPDDVAADGARGPVVRPTSGFAGRNQLAYQMLSVGYSPQEIADVLTGRITLRALDVARNMIAGGLGRDRAADYLDSQYKRLVREVVPPPSIRPDVRPRTGGGTVIERAPAPAAGAALPTTFDAVIDEQARRYGVSARVIRALIEAESGFNPAARSSSGAIGLMQLMPSTARSLGVNPFVPEQNIEGGVRYFSELLKMFGKLDLALVAYNAGPGFAERFAAGLTPLYGETRRYVDRILARLQ